MYTRFHDNTIETKFIKYIISKSNIPTVPLWRKGDYCIKDFIYIRNSDIVVCTKTGNSDKDFKVISPYVKGDSYFGITTNYISNESGYDSVTHSYLGDYLRSIRDLNGIDLMPYYNCFNGEYADNVRINKDGGLYVSSDSSYKVYSVPVKFNRKYYVYIDCKDISMAYGYYGNKGVLYDSNNAILSYGVNSTGLYNNFNKPIVVSELKAVENGIQFERFLRLFIQVPSSSKSAIVVIESEDLEGTLGCIDNNYNYIKTNLGLTQLSVTDNYAFSDRLIEHLLLNVITPEDEICENIESVQKYITSDKFKAINGYKYANGKYVKGVYSNDLKEFIKKLSSFGKGIRHIDVDGYINKDVEILAKGD